MELPPVIIRYLEAYNRLDAAGLAACVSDDIVFENVSNSGESLTLKGKRDFQALAEKSAAMFSARRQIVRMAVVQDDRVALEIDWAGIPVNDLPGMPAGKRISLRGATFMTLRDGAIITITDLS
jgi:steroid delta-isomerase-like uncharacterized protein